MTNYKSIFGLSVLLLGFFLIYSDTILSLSLFGDATIHGSITKQILNHSISDSKFTYPPLYNILQGLLFLLFGEKGMNLIVLLGLILISISIFLLAKEITGKTFIGFLSIIIVLSSPKLIFYSSRMYMEILLSGFFIYSIYLLMRFVKTKSIKDLILLTFFIVITSSIKQQGLFILFPSILLFLFIFFLVERQRLREKKVILDSLKKVGIFLMIFIILISPIYLALFHSVGRIIPGNEDYKVIKITNQIGQKITALVNNTHMLHDTKVEDIELGNKLVKEIANELNIPIKYTVCKENLCQYLPDKLEGEIFPIQIYMREDWMQF